MLVNMQDIKKQKLNITNDMLAEIRKLSYKVTGYELEPVNLGNLAEHIELLNNELAHIKQYHAKNQAIGCRPTQIKKIRQLFYMLTDGREILEHTCLAYQSKEEASVWIDELNDNIKNKNKLATKKQVEYLQILLKKIDPIIELRELVDMIELTRKEADGLIKELENHVIHGIISIPLKKQLRRIHQA